MEISGPLYSDSKTTNLCSTCQLNNTLIYRLATATTAAKKARLEQQLVLIVCNVLLLYYNKEIMCIKKIILFSLFVALKTHLKDVDSGRATLIQLAKAETAKHGVTSLHHTKDIQTAHYSFDYAHYAQVTPAVRAIVFPGS